MYDHWPFHLSGIVRDGLLMDFVFFGDGIAPRLELELHNWWAGTWRGIETIVG